MAKDCFCGCGASVPWGRRRATNALGAQFDRDIEMFRSACKRPEQHEHAAELAELVAIGEPLRDGLRDVMHGTLHRKQFDKPAMKAWLDRAHRQRSRLAREIAQADFAGWNAHEQARLIHAGRQAPAVIIDVEDTGAMVGHDPRVRLRLRVEPAGEEPFELERKIVVSRVAVPRVGERVEVSYDPDDRGRFTFRIADLTDDGVQSDRVAQLERLAALHAGGTLTDEEFAAEKARVLNGP